MRVCGKRSKKNHGSPILPHECHSTIGWGAMANDEYFYLPSPWDRRTYLKQAFGWKKNYIHKKIQLA